MKKVFIIFAVLGYLLAVVSEATIISHVKTSYLTGAVEFLIWIIFIPVLYKAGKSARVKNKTIGDVSLRISGWVLFGVSIVNGIMLFQWGLFNGTGNNATPDSMILVNALMFLLASIFMFIDYNKSSS